MVSVKNKVNKNFIRICNGIIHLHYFNLIFSKKGK